MLNLSGEDTSSLDREYERVMSFESNSVLFLSQRIHITYIAHNTNRGFDNNVLKMGLLIKIIIKVTSTRTL